MVKTIVFVIIIILLSFLLSFQTKFSGQTRNLYRYGPKNTDPLSATLTYFSRSQTHFCAKNWKLKIHITSSFMIGFWWSFVGMDYYTTPCWWPIFRWPWPTSSVRTRNRPEIFCHRFGQNWTSEDNASNVIGWLLPRTIAGRSLVKID